MEYQNIKNLFGSTINEASRYRLKNKVEINFNAGGITDKSN